MSYGYTTKKVDLITKDLVTRDRDIIKFLLEESMNCRRCKKLIDGNDMFCKHCGAAISIDTVSANTDMLIYEESAEEITIVGFNREKMVKGTAIIIPKHINGKSVTKIGNMAFCNCCDIISITIPDSVREIESAAFAGCCSLYHVVLPSNLKEISASLFNLCLELRSQRKLKK